MFYCTQEIPSGKGEGEDKDLDTEDNRDNAVVAAARLENTLLTDLDRTCVDNTITRDMNSPMIKET